VSETKGRSSQKSWYNELLSKRRQNRAASDMVIDDRDYNRILNAIQAGAPSVAFDEGGKQNIVQMSEILGVTPGVRSTIEGMSPDQVRSIRDAVCRIQARVLPCR
jgi:hypothetical protein